MQVHRREGLIEHHGDKNFSTPQTSDGKREDFA
jgi:hypothetical protein